MTVALLGATSFLAQALLKKWTTSSIAPSLRCYSRRPMPAAKGLEWRAYNYPNTPLDVAELLDCSVIYFCAGAGIQPKNTDAQQYIYGLNAFEPIQLAVALEAAGYTGKLVTFGSYFEIGDQSEARAYTPAEIASHRNPLPNAYCHAKNLLTRFADSKLLPNATALPYCWQHFILTNIYGAAENDQRLIPYIVQSSVAGKALEFTAGVQQRQYTHIDDVTDFLIQYLEQRQSGVFNLTDTTVRSVRSVIETVLDAVEKHLGQRPDAQFGTLDKRDVSMGYLALDMTQQPTAMPFVPKISLEQGLEAYLKRYAPVS